MDWRALIDQAQAEIEHVTPETVEVECAGAILQLTFLPVLGEEWDDITAMHRPRPGSVSDGNVGYNTDAVAKDYPASRVTINAETPTQEEWQKLLTVLTSPNRKNIAVMLWGLNQKDPVDRFNAAIALAGKGSAGVAKTASASRVNSASPRAGSRAGSRRK